MIITDEVFNNLEFKGTEYPTIDHLWYVLNRLQKRHAKEGITIEERQKIELSRDEIVLKWAQIGGYVVCKNDKRKRFFFHDGMGCIQNGRNVVVGCSLREFVNSLS